VAPGARELIDGVAAAVAGWRDVARDAGIPKAKVVEVASVFAPLASVADVPSG
jgi:hypothetical protein